jgi:hypothetical protein
MIRLFKKPTKNIDAEIYDSIYSAHSRILAESKKIIAAGINCADNTIDNEVEVEKLMLAGFHQIPSVISYKKKLEKIRQLRIDLWEAESIRDAITEYSIHYPFNKFIDGPTVDKICKKYKLVISSVSDFIGEIPQKNLDEIIAFKVRRKDIYDINTRSSPYLKTA